jgi:putative ABC transport system permease protein
MILLKLLSWQYASRHLLRSVLTTAGIVLGVSVFVGMHIANQSVLYVFHQTIDRIAGKTRLQISAGESGFPEEVLDGVQSRSEVQVAVPVIEAVVDTELRGQGQLLILAVDMTGDRSLRDYSLEEGQSGVMEDPLIFLAQPDSLIVTSTFAARNGLGINSRLAMRTMDGTKQFTVRGILRSGGMASAFGGNLAIMDIYAAQKVFGRGREFDRIDLSLKPDVALRQAQTALQQWLGAGFEVDVPAGRGQQFEALLRVYSLSINVSSLFAMFIGMFIIYNAFAIAVTQRRFEVGVLRALGATRGQIRTLFLSESAILGLVGSALGIACGVGLAKVLVGYTRRLMEEVYGLSQNSNEVFVDPRLLMLALLVGVAASMIGAWIPARRASQVDPIRALQKGKYQVLSEGESRARRIVAALLGSASLACLVFATSGFLFYSGCLLLIGAVLLLAPALASMLGRALRWPLKKLRPVEGALAADSLIRAPKRTSATVAALMLSLAMAISMGGVARGGYDSIQEWLRTTLNSDLFVSTSQNLSLRSFHFPESMAAGLAQIEGVAEIQTVRTSRVSVRGIPVMVFAMDMAKQGQHTRGRRVVAGNFDHMHELAAQGRGLIASENFTQMQRLKLGDTVELSTPTGRLQLPIVGIVRDYSNLLGALFLDAKVYRRSWGDDTVDTFQLYLTPGASGEDVKRRILDAFGHERRLFVLANAEVKSYILRITDQWFGMTYVQIAIAVLVAILGIVNTLTVSIADRRSELGILRAVGGLRQQIRFTIWMEACSIGLIGLIMGLAFGAVLLFYLLEMIRRDFGGLPLDYEFPLSMALLLLPVIMISAFASSLAPAESAVRSPLVEALEYE